MKVDQEHGRNMTCVCVLQWGTLALGNTSIGKYFHREILALVKSIRREHPSCQELSILQDLADARHYGDKCTGA